MGRPGARVFPLRPTSRARVQSRVAAVSLKLQLLEVIYPRQEQHIVNRLLTQGYGL